MEKIDKWEKGIRELARHPEICCKVSGIVTEAGWEQWNPDIDQQSWNSQK